MFTLEHTTAILVRAIFFSVLWTKQKVFFSHFTTYQNLPSKLYLIHQTQMSTRRCIRGKVRGRKRLYHAEGICLTWQNWNVSVLCSHSITYKAKAAPEFTKSPFIFLSRTTILILWSASYKDKNKFLRFFACSSASLLLLNGENKRVEGKKVFSIWIMLQLRI